jgi:hypothetical protein
MVFKKRLLIISLISSVITSINFLFLWHSSDWFIFLSLSISVIIPIFCGYFVYDKKINLLNSFLSVICVDFVYIASFIIISFHDASKCNHFGVMFGAWVLKKPQVYLNYFSFVLFILFVGFVFLSLLSLIGQFIKVLINKIYRRT